ncbi:MAG: CPBP family intramembrane metalloprotease [Nitrospira sp.]|nr:CPBP family intramembrane metalloprotease [Nitrospira sp.]
MKISEKFFPPYLGWFHGLLVFGGYLLASLAAKAGFSFGVGFLEGLLNIQFPKFIAGVNFFHSLEILRVIVGQVAGGAVLVILLQFFSKKFPQDLWNEIGWAPCRIGFLLRGFLFGAAWGIAILVGRSLLLGDIATSKFTPDGLNLFFWCIPSLLLAPILEETLYRGILYLGILNSWGRTWAFGISTILFSLSHSQYLLNGKFPFLFIFMAYTMSGIAILILRIRYNSLFPSIAFHCSYNLIGISSVLLGSYTFSF